MRPRPDVAGPGQESVWDYPRPPRLEPTTALLEVVLGGAVVAATREGWRVLETSHPPTYYLPRSAFAPGTLRPTAGASWCEWKGAASYVDLVVPGAPRVADVGWTYPDPSPAFAAIAGHVAFYPQRVDACSVDGEPVQANEGDFYGGWITSKVVGPFKGGAGTWGW